MSKPDYYQIAEDHSSLLVLVRPIGTNIKPKIFNKLFDRISHLNQFGVAKPLRNINFKYKRNYTKEESQWGSFQAHRKVLGLITIGKCSEDQEDEASMNDGDVDNCQEDLVKNCKTIKESKVDLINLHHQTSELFEDTLLDSILIILDNTYISERDSTSESLECSLLSPAEIEQSSTEKIDGENNVKLHPDGSCYFASSDNEVIKDRTKTLKAANGDMPNSHVWFFRGETDCGDLEHRMQDFFNSLFWVLESKRMDRSHERNDLLVLLMAPPEKEMGLPVDAESRGYKKKCLGRYRKHLGDLSLLAGIPGEASLHYQTCLDILKTTNDWLWIAGAQEGLAVASYLILKPKTSQFPSFARNLSFSVKRPLSRGRDLFMAASLQSAATSSLQSGLDLANNRVTTSVTTETLHEDILTNYKDAVVNYSKVKEACIIELEASLKACRILAMYRRVVDASDFLQNVIKINPQLSDEEKVEQFSTLAGLYSHLGLHRKSAFYSRISAMVCVAPSNKKESWPNCYHLLLQSLHGFKLSLDYRDMIESPDSPNGWPSVKLRVMHELIYSRRRLGDTPASIRHLSLLLNTMFDHLSNAERIELCNILQSYTTKHQSTPYSMALEDGTILPPVPLTKLPIFRRLETLELASCYMPNTFKRDKSSNNHNGRDGKMSHPFIYSPFIDADLDSLGQSKHKKDSKSKEIIWVAGDTGKVSLYFKNPLVVELTVTNLDLIVEGLEIKVEPMTFTLPPQSDDTRVDVSVNPCTVGKMNIIGYTWEVFGVKSIIKFKEIQQNLKKQFGSVVLESSECNIDENYITVVTSLPLMQISISSSLISCTKMDKTIGHLITHSPVDTGSLVIYAGQRHNFKVTLINIESLPIERIDLIKSANGLDEDILGALIKCSSEQDLLDKLPLQSGDKLEVDFQVDGVSNFLSRNLIDEFHSKNKKRYVIDEFVTKRERFVKLLQKHMSPGDTMKAELSLLFQYNGGTGKKHCRQCSLSIPLFVLPSITVLQWKVTPGPSFNEATLALELKNSSEVVVEIFLGNCNSQVLTIEPYQVIWLHCVVPRLSNNFQRTKTDPSLDDFDLLGFHSQDYRELPIDHLEKYLNLKWRMPVINIEGVLSLEDIPFSREECRLLQKPLIAWDVSIDGTAQNEKSTFSLDVLQCAHVDITLKNEAGFDWHDIKLSISLDGEGKGEEPGENVIFIGPLLTNRRMLRPDELLPHSFSMLPTRTATTQLVFNCCATHRFDEATECLQLPNQSATVVSSPSSLSSSSSSTLPSTALPSSSSSMTLTNNDMPDNVAIMSPTNSLIPEVEEMSAVSNPDPLENGIDSITNSILLKNDPTLLDNNSTIITQSADIETTTKTLPDDSTPTVNGTKLDDDVDKDVSTSVANFDSVPTPAVLKNFPNSDNTTSDILSTTTATTMLPATTTMYPITTTPHKSEDKDISYNGRPMLTKVVEVVHKWSFKMFISSTSADKTLQEESEIFIRL